MKKALRVLKRWWWVAAGAIAAALFVLWQILKPKGSGSEPAPGLPRFAERAKAEAERVRLEGEVEKAKIRATGDAQRQEIESIEEKAKEDPVQARQDMAEWLAKNL